MQNEQTETKTPTLADLERYGISVTWEFIPWSKSRSYSPDKKYRERTFEYRVTIKKDDREILKTEYGMGLWHSPTDCVRLPGRVTLNVAEVIEFETQNGRTATLDEPIPGDGWPIPMGEFRDTYRITKRDFWALGYLGLKSTKSKPINPDPVNIFWCILLDSDALDYGDFTDWASSYGYDPDSRTAETIYRTCLEHGLKLRNALGDSVLTELRELFQDY